VLAALVGMASVYALGGLPPLVEAGVHHLALGADRIGRLLGATLAAGLAAWALRALHRLGAGKARRQAMALAGVTAIATTAAVWWVRVGDLPTTDYRLGMEPNVDFAGGTPPHHVHINDQGFRDVDRPDVPALRVLLVGDSCVFGTGVELGDTLGQQLEARLRTLLGVNVEVYNLGIPGNNLLSATEIAERMARDVGCDAVLLAHLPEAMLVPLDMAWRRRAIARDGLYRVAAALFGEGEAYALATLEERAGYEPKSRDIIPEATRRLKTIADQWHAGLEAFCYSPCHDLQSSGIAAIAFDDFRRRPGLTLPDRHPSAAGNAWLVDQLAPRLLPILKARPLRLRRLRGQTGAGDFSGHELGPFREAAGHER